MEKVKPCHHGIKGLCETCEAERDLKQKQLEDERTKYLRMHDWSSYMKDRF